MLTDKEEDERWISVGSEEESEISSGEGRMVIDLPSSPAESNNSKSNNSESNPSGQQQNNVRSIKTILANRVLEHLEKSSSRSKTISDTVTSFPPNQLVVDVLERLKKSVQQKNAAGIFQDATKDEEAGKLSGNTGTLNVDKEVLSRGSDAGTNAPNKLKLVSGQEKKAISEQRRARLPRESSGSNPCSDSEFPGKRKRHKKRKSKKSREGRNQRHEKFKDRISGEEKVGNLSLESVSSENENDIFNKLNSNGEFEEGEVFSSSSDWEFNRKVKRRRRGKSSPSRLKHFTASSSDKLRRSRDRCTRAPSPPWLHLRPEPEKHGRYKIRSPTHYVHKSSWRDHRGWGHESQGRVVVPRLVPRPRSLSIVPTHLRAKSPPIGKMSSRQSPSTFIDHFGYHREFLPTLAIYRSSSSSWEEVRESKRNPLLKTCTSLDMDNYPGEPTQCRKIRIEPRFLPEPGSDTRKKPSLLLRCLREIQHRLPLPGRFLYSCELKDSTRETYGVISDNSSPLSLSEIQAPQLKFTTPSMRSVGTDNSSFQSSTTSIGCQTDKFQTAL